MPTLRRTPIFSAAILFIASLSLEAGSFASQAWTDDSNSGIDPIRTVWAYNFGTSNSTSVNDVLVAGVAGVEPQVAGRFSFTGSAATLNDSNFVITGSGGSSVIASNFVFGGVTRPITISGLCPGVEYTATILLVGWDDAPGVRTSIFTSGSDTTTYDLNAFGNDRGMRVEYTFIAASAQQVITISSAQPSDPTFHVYGLALRKEPIVVTNTNDDFASAGTLRAAINSAASGSLITFAPILGSNPQGSDTRIQLENGAFLINKDLTIDASEVLNRFGFPLGITINARNNSGGFLTQGLGKPVDISAATGTTASQSSESSEGSFPATNAIDGDPSTFSKTGVPDIIVNPGDIQAPSLTATFGRAHWLGALKITNVPRDFSTNQSAVGNLADIRVELYDRLSRKIWTSGLLNPENGGLAPKSTFGPNELTVTFPPMDVYRVKIIGKESNVVPALAIAELQAFAPGVTLRSLTFRNCQTSGGGGAIENSGRLALVDCQFRDNSALIGGAINNTGVLAIAGSTFERNSASSPSDSGIRLGGGAIFNAIGSTLAIAQSSFSDNSANGRGGAICTLGRDESNVSAVNADLSNTLTICDTQFTGNTAGQDALSSSRPAGGAIYTHSASLSVEDSQFTENTRDKPLLLGSGIYAHEYGLDIAGCTFTSNDGSAIYAAGEVRPVLSNSSFIGNSDPVSGGAVFAFGIRATNCLFSGNAAPTGGAIFSDVLNGSFTNCSFLGNAATQGAALNLIGTESGMRFTNCLLWDNQTAGSVAPSPIAGTSPQYSSCLMQGVDLTLLSTSNLNGTLPQSNPQLYDPVPQRATVTPSLLGSARFGSSSPLRDAGNNQGNLTLSDLTGDPRVVGNRIDIGAIEFQGEFAELPFSFDFDPDNDGYSTGLEYAIGSDPYVADFDHPNRLKITLIPQTGATPLRQFSFGVDEAFQDHIILEMKSVIGFPNFSGTILSNRSTLFASPFSPATTRSNESQFFRLEAELR